jgi:hypothetical protein
VLMATTYRKSSKGAAEIETRAHRLSPRLRAALIVVDGRRNTHDLYKLIPQQAEETLAALLEQGFIEPVSEGSASAPPTPAPTAAPRPAARPAAVDFETHRRDAVRRLTDQVGPMGEALAMRIERCRSAEELRPLIGLAAQVIANTRGRAAAADFTARFSEL